MMNEIILNGTSSSEIKGLIIQSLPPISKPQIRTRTEEIDGRDGDIVTPLGYAAYDKTFNIGLSYDYDIDDVISYFNSEGTVTFSNEPDKYYNYEILDQIDFERLIRFKTAVVKMHVQPFKYSTIEVEKHFVTNLLSFNDYTRTINGITLQASGGTISISGTGTAATEFYMPIETLELSPGYYTLSAYSTGDSPNACSIRLIYDSPSSANSFGGTYVTLQDDNAVTINANLDTTKTYNYIYFYITPNTTLNFSLYLTFDDNTDSFVVRNSGNYFSKPTFTIFGSGTITLSINQIQVFLIQLGNERYITIDSEAMEAYKDGVLKNRLVNGDYDNCYLEVGKNEIDLTGNVTVLEVQNYSRWI